MRRESKTGGRTTREDLLAATARLLRERGYHGAGLKDILTLAGAPRGSLYHHFPGGKDELVMRAMQAAGQRISQSLTKALEEPGALADPAATLDAVALQFQSELIDSGYSHGCPIATVALETGATRPQIAAAAADIYADWTGQLCSLLDLLGGGAEENRALAECGIALLEGALLLSRSQRSPQPLERARALLRNLLMHHAAGAPQRRKPVAQTVRELQLPDELAEKLPELLPLLLEADPEEASIHAYAQVCRLALVIGSDAVLLAAEADPEQGQGVLEIKNVAVSADARDRGLGSQLIRAAVRGAGELGYGRILIATGNSSLGQLYLYQKLGFELAGLEPGHFLRPPYDRPIYENGLQCRDRLILTQATQPLAAP